MKNLFIIFIGLVFIACGGYKSNDGKVMTNYELLEAKVDSLFYTHYNKDSPGAALLIRYKGEKIISKGYGLRNLSRKQPITSSTNFRSASLAKQFTALGVLNLMENGKLNLTDTVYNYLSYPVFEDITIEHLISHTSGLVDAEYVIKRGSQRFLTNEDIIEWYAKNDSSRFSPGSDFEYNNGAYIILAKIIEISTGLPFHEYMREKIFEKVGMTSTSFVNISNPEAIKEKALRYEKDRLGIWQSMEGKPRDYLIGAGGIYTNLNDYSKYVEALRNKKIFTSKTHNLIFDPISMNTELHSGYMSILKGRKSSYAMGWEVTDSLAVSGGEYYGVNNWVIFEYNRPLTIVILTNNNLLFKERLVDKTYKIVDRYFDTYGQQGI
ncbi:MAG: serine hydrolase domain-containing protein [Balneolaceae bacterium]|nr:serine hydrolase domain-containing protein [Balneolaceae bacterium]